MLVPASYGESPEDIGPSVVIGENACPPSLSDDLIFDFFICYFVIRAVLGLYFIPEDVFLVGGSYPITARVSGQGTKGSYLYITRVPFYSFLIVPWPFYC